MEVRAERRGDEDETTRKMQSWDRCWEIVVLKLEESVSQDSLVKLMIGAETEQVM